MRFIVKANFVNKKRILVTGANGFIGQHLCRLLLDSGYYVRGMFHDNYPLYFIKKGEIEWFEGDVTNKHSIQDICKTIDFIVHLAAIPRNDLRKNWQEFYNVNVCGTHNLLEDAAKSKIRRFIYLSTVEAAGYGDGLNPRHENDVPNPINNYGKSKLLAEQGVFSNEWLFERTIIRLPMIYGPGTMLIVPKLFGMVKRGFYPFIGSGNTLMEFCYVGNAIHAIKLAIENDSASGNLFYVSDERSYSIKEVIDAISKSLNKKYIPLYIPKQIAYLIAMCFELFSKIFPFPPIVSPYSKKPFFTKETVDWTTQNINLVSTEKIRHLLGYEPLFSIDEGCKLTVGWLSKTS